MTIHTTNPFADADPDPVRRFRGRLGGAVTLWTSGDLDGEHAGLTISSLMAARGEPGLLLALVDPASGFRETIESTGLAVVHLLQWRHRDLSEVFAGLMPAPGGAFRAASWQQSSHGPVIDPAPSHALVELDDVRAVGWSDLVTTRVREVVLAVDEQPLEHRRGRYHQAPGGEPSAGKP